MNYKEYVVKIYDNGDKHWYLDGKLHREDGPAVECINGDKYWYSNGKCHREDGPAIEFASGNKYWYLNGVKLTKEEFNTIQSNYSGKIVEIDGKKYKLQENERRVPLSKQL